VEDSAAPLREAWYYAAPGRHLRVSLIEFIRPEKKFAGLDALKAQIAADAARAREILSAVPLG